MWSLCTVSAHVVFQAFFICLLGDLCNGPSWSECAPLSMEFTLTIWTTENVVLEAGEVYVIDEAVVRRTASVFSAPW